jgi:RNA polymerase sigma-70 factor (ECF subfamily)
MIDESSRVPPAAAGTAPGAARRPRLVTPAPTKLAPTGVTTAAVQHQVHQTISDEELVERVARGDRAAYGELVARHLDRTVTVARRIVQSPSEAEDIAQEAFLRLWQHAARFRPGEARFTTWFYRITSNLCLDHRRRRTALPLEAAGDPVDPAEDQQALLERTRTARAVAAAVKELPERQRAAIALTYDSGMSNAEAARVLDITVGAMETLLVRARRSLRAALAHHISQTTSPAGHPAEGPHP